jgi:hypothetical protein
MKLAHKRRIAATSLFVMAAILQTYAGVTFAARAAGLNPLAVAVQEITGSLTTCENKPILVNGASTITGATILSGALVQTPVKVSATINISGHGTLDLAPDTHVIIEFDQAGNIKVMLRQGCVTLHTQKGTTGEIDNAQGVVGKTNPAIADVLDTCHSVKTAGAAAGGGGLGTGGTIAIVAGIGAGITGIAFALRGSNPSPSTP